MAALMEYVLHHLIEHNPLRGMIACLCTGVILHSIFSLNPFKRNKRHASQPASASPTVPIPWLGHLIGLMRHGADYFTMLSRSSSQPILALSLPAAKIYLITSPEAVQAAYRDQNLAILPLALMFLQRACGGSKQFSDKLLKESQSSHSNNYWFDMNKIVRDQLAGGESLHQMNSRVLDTLSGVLSGLETETRLPDFYMWMWRHMFGAKTDALYGDQNPFKSESLVNAYWDWELGHLDVLMRPFASLTAQKAFRGRKRVLEAFECFTSHYTTNEMGDDVSSMIRARTAINEKWNLDHGASAATELALLYGTSANAIPTLYWMLLYVSNDQALWQDLRDEVAGVVQTSEGGVCTIDATKLGSCSLLKSAYQETLRLVSRHPGARIVERDTVLKFPVSGSESAASYLLKKGSVIQMPAGLLHKAEATWGPTAEQFDARRFLKAGPLSSDEKARDKRQRNAYIPLGGGKHLCPGRYFSFTEILGVVAAFVTGFEMVGEGESPPTVPGQAHQLGLGIVKPVSGDNLDVRIKRRVGWEGRKWKFHI